MINAVYRLVAPGMIDIACTEPDLKKNVIMLSLIHISEPTRPY